jgi:2-methylisocitrate lyase-like PEP mutase family enzyme
MRHPDHAAVFRRLHEPGAFLILANAWDAGSARVIEECGAPAIATSSAGLAWAHGYADGHALPVRSASTSRTARRRPISSAPRSRRRSAPRRGPASSFSSTRTDVFLHRLVPAGDALAVTIERGAQYRRAGADGIFVPYLLAPDDVRAVVAAIAPLPLIAMATAKLPPAAELRALGVRRLSAGAAIASRALARGARSRPPSSATGAPTRSSRRPSTTRH